MPADQSRQLLLSPAALGDLRGIYRYGLDNRGHRRSTEYIAALKSLILSLSENPLVGRERHDIGEGLRSLKCGKHLVFYRLTDRAVEVARVLHERQDPASLHD